MTWNEDEIHIEFDSGRTQALFWECVSPKQLFEKNVLMTKARDTIKDIMKNTQSKKMMNQTLL